MNHSQAPTLHIRRILHVPMLSPSQKKSKAADPIVIRRTYDMTAACGRESEGEEGGAVTMRVRGTRTTPLGRCIAIGAAAVGVLAAAAAISRVRQSWIIRRKYARRYAALRRQQKLRMRVHEGGKRSALQKT